MFFIPHRFIDIITFPGVIIHQTARRIFAQIAGVPVYEVRYFRFADPAGYVEHGQTDHLKSITLITVGPLIVNTLLCAIFTLPATYEYFVLSTEESGPLLALLWWIGLSIGMHALPDNNEIAELQAVAKNTKEEGFGVSTVKGFAVVVKILNWLRIIWFDLVYAILVSLAFPFVLWWFQQS